MKKLCLQAWLGLSSFWDRLFIARDWGIAAFWKPRKRRALKQQQKRRLQARLQLEGLEVRYLPSTFNFLHANVSVNESAGQAAITVKRDGSLEGSALVSYNTSDGSAVSSIYDYEHEEYSLVDNDYLQSCGTLYFDDGQSLATFNVTIIDNSEEEGDEYFYGSLFGPSENSSIGEGNVSVTIFEGDGWPSNTGPAFRFAASSFFVSESGGTATITVERMGSAVGSASVQLTAADGSATGEDWHLDEMWSESNGMLYFDDGQSTATACISIADDEQTEDDEYVHLGLANASDGYDIDQARGSADLTIVDNDEAPAFRFSASEYVTLPFSTAVTVTVVRRGWQSDGTSIDYYTSDGTAVSPDDYESASSTLNFDQGQVAASFTVTIHHNDQAETEGQGENGGEGEIVVEGSSGEDKQFFVHVVNPAPYMQGESWVYPSVEGDTATVTMPDIRPAFRFTQTSWWVSESVGEASITVERPSWAVGSASVDYYIGDDPENANPQDENYYSHAGTVYFESGQTTAHATVSIFDDGDMEEDEFQHITLLHPSDGYVIDSTQGSTTLVIVDNDEAPSFRFLDVNKLVGEGGGYAHMTVERRGPDLGGASVDFATAGGTASTDGDYGAVSGTLTFAPGQMTASFDVPIGDDELIEGNEYVEIDLFNASSGSYDYETESYSSFGIETPIATVTIVDDEEPSTFYITQSDYWVGEVAQSTTITVERTGTGRNSASIDIRTRNGTAQAGSDYTALLTTLFFDVGQTSITTSIALITDTVLEDDEFFALELFNPSQGNSVDYSRRTAKVTIVDNDELPELRFSEASYSVNEGAGQATFTVVRRGNHSGMVVVNWAISDGTATAGSDYSGYPNSGSTSGIMLFNSGQVSCPITVSIASDNIWRGDNYFQLTLSNPNTYGAVNYHVAIEPTIVTIHDSKSPPVAVDDMYDVPMDAALDVGAGQSQSGLLSNDQGAVGALLGVSQINGAAIIPGEAVTLPSGASLVMHVDGSFHYAPIAGYAGTDSFTYEITDGNEDSNVGTVWLNVTNALSDDEGTRLFAVEPDGSLSVSANNGLLSNSEEEAVVLFTNVHHGNFTLHSNGSFEYQADPRFSGIDTFTYRTYDGGQYSDPQMVVLRVTYLPPVAAPHTYTNIPAGAAFTGTGLLAQAEDPQGLPLSARLARSPAHGAITVHANGSFDYVPNPGFIGIDTFEYEAFDQNHGSSPALVTLVVTGSLPTSVNRAYSVHAGELFAPLPSMGVLAVNGSVPAGKTMGLVTGAAHGSLKVYADGSFAYQSDRGFTGTDSFTYRVFGATGVSPVATVTLQVTNQAPVAQNDSYTLHAGSTITRDLVWQGGSLVNTGITDNDTDAENDRLIANLLTGPQNGSLTLNTNGTFSYTPRHGYAGSDSFTYQVFDSCAFSNVATVTFTVTNSAPAAADDSYVAPAGATFNSTVGFGASVVSNDSDADSDDLTVSLVTGPQHGSLSLRADGTFSYTPQSSFTGTDHFSYRAFDGVALSNTATATLEVTTQTPIATNDNYNVPSGTAIDYMVTASSFGILSNDLGYNGPPLWVHQLSSPQHGRLDLNPDGGFSYSSFPGYAGLDTFLYEASDGLTTSAPASVTFVVGNSAPIAISDQYSVPSGGTLLTVKPNNNSNTDTSLFANDVDPDGNPLTVNLVSGTSYGTLSVMADGTFTYVPRPGFVGADLFCYQAFDGVTLSDAVSVVIQVTGAAPHDPIVNTPAIINAAPLAMDESYLVHAGSSLTVSTPTAAVATSLHADSSRVGVLANDFDADGDLMLARLESGVSHGVLQFNSDGTFSYHPFPDFTGIDSFVYVALDGQAAGNANAVVVKLVVTGTPPLGMEDAYSTGAGQTLVANGPVIRGVLANDIDADGDLLSARLVSGPMHGSLILNSNGTFHYEPNPGFAGEDSFVYQSFDGSSLGNTAVAHITVLGSGLVTRPDTYAVRAGSELGVLADDGVLANDKTEANHALAARLLTGPAHGLLLLNGDGGFTYRPLLGYSGEDTFTYEASDEFGVSTGAVQLLVANSVPNGAVDAYVVTSDSLVDGEFRAVFGTGIPSVLSNDSDGEGLLLTARLTSGVQHGSLVLNSDGTFVYTPVAAFVGTDQFVYRAGNGINWSDNVTVTLIIPGGGVPRALNDVLSTTGTPTYSITFWDSGAGVMANDIALPNEVVRAQLVSTVAHGQLLFNSDGTFAYTPAPSYKGLDSFTYRDVTPKGSSNIATMTIFVPGSAPTIRAGYWQVSADGQLDDTLLSADASSSRYTVEGIGPFGAALFRGPLHGTLDLNPDGTFKYTPDARYVGDDRFLYRLSDGRGNSLPAVAHINVFNQAPSTVSEAYTVHGNNGYTVDNSGFQSTQDGGLLVDDADPDGDSLQPRLVMHPTHGRLSLSNDGTFTYLPDPSYLGADSFTYQAFDGRQLGNTATVTLNVGNTAPVALNDLYGTLPQTPITRNVLANDFDPDGDALIADLVSESTSNLQWSTSGQFTFTPPPNSTGTYIFTYRIRDGLGLSSTATFSIEVSTNPPPTQSQPTNTYPKMLGIEMFRVTHDQVLVRLPNEGLLGNVFTSPSWPGVPQWSIFVASYTQPQHGRVEVFPSGAFQYVPDAEYEGNDYFPYVLSNGVHKVANIDVTNQPPKTERDECDIVHDNVLTVSAANGVLKNDTDPENDALTAREAAGKGPHHGELTFKPDGAFSYKPDPGFVGEDEFGYQINDGASPWSAVAYVKIEVKDERPKGVADSYTVMQGQPLLVDFQDGMTANDTDTDDGLLMATIVQAPQHGTFEPRPSGAFRKFRAAAL
ncbi:MAG TPA: Ig-like domain-containing protein, partial [Gemmataceae bacterium]|nr:Ig-like domain-containing protein [Gemmataceae bacterium]